MTTEFTDLTITGIDNEKTLSTNNGRDSMYWVHFKLSERPQPDWVTIFEREAKSLRHTMQREMKYSNQVSAHYMTVHCPIEEIEPHHKQDMIDLVASTNVKYREHVKEWRAKKEREENARRAAHDKAADALKKIKF